MNKLFIIILLATVPLVSSSQTHEFGIHVGMMNYIGDISPQVNTAEFHPTFGGFYKWNHNPFFISRFSFNYGSVSAADKAFTYNRIRNLSFNSEIYELSYMTEFNFQPHGYDKFKNEFTPFVALGVSGFYFNPYAEYRNQSYELRKYGTEGQFLRHTGTYTKFDYAIPFGGGVKLHMSKNIILAIETIWRHTATDHLDDVGSGNYMQNDKGQYVYTGYPDPWDMNKFNDIKPDYKPTAIALADRSGEVNKETNISYRGKQRGNPYNKDWYFSLGFTLSYKIIKVTCNRGGF
ncbi:MAG: hypothetical protein HYZ42_15515 [Bacteroidetes bacterium]|nr:hypothetical protein [Bacteroidota bacterium]